MADSRTTHPAGSDIASSAPQPGTGLLGLLITALSLFVLILAANLPAPLYAVYRQLFGFSTAVLTLIFATYAVVLVPSLLFFGQLSDKLGRRPVIITGLVIGICSLVLFSLARGTGWLFGARALQGLAVGAATGAATAALVELDADRGLAAMLATLATAGGTAMGPILGGALAQWAPAPLVLCYVLGAGLALAALTGIVRLPEPLRTAPSGGFRIQRPHVPAGIRVQFARASITAAAVWSVAALYVSVVPSYAARLLTTHNLALLGAISAVMLGMSCATQLGFKNRDERVQPVGLLGLVVGLLLLVGCFPLHSLALLVAAAVFAGAGHGLAFLGAQAQINRICSPQRRGEVGASFYVCIYMAVAASVTGVGIASDVISLFGAVALFACVVASVAMLTAVWHVVTSRHTRQTS
jgi:MFS family permease